MNTAKMLGHTNAAMILKVYGQPLPDNHYEAATITDALLERHEITE